MSTKIALNFIEQINTHNVDRLVSLLTDDHIFIDAHGNKVVGKKKMKAGWIGYFDWFPDYHIEVEHTYESGESVGIFGYASGSFRGMNDNKRWRLPSSWHVIVERDKIKLWQVYADTKIPFDIIERYSRIDNGELNMILGFGGVFFKSNDPPKLCKWYDEHLGTNFGENSYFGFKWRERVDPSRIGRTEFSIFPEATKYFLPSDKPFMFNFRVRNLEAFLKKLRNEGVQVEDKVERYEYGNFGWIIDLEGNKIELWEPIDEVLEK